MSRAWTFLRALLLAPPLYVLLLGLGLMSLAWNLIALLLHPLLPAARGRAVGRAGIAHGYRLFWTVASAVGMMRIDARCLAPLKAEQGLIIAANHPTMLDALLLVAHLPRSACIMKASLMKNIFLGAGARLARYIRNDSAHAMVKQAVADLKAGGQLVIFPEATRTTEWPLNSFTPGVTLIAKLAQAPIQTVFIDTDSPYLGKGWPIWRVPPLPIVFSLRLGERFAPQPDSHAMTAMLERYFRQHIEATGQGDDALKAAPACPPNPHAPTSF
ncbi:lysophospholipid acyltransferase family protein [Xenophilus arseniciresistens]|uniref:Lysophospholipid acyltransferase family protein n=1 Tax=Xenophilus arseniciresistens TaxID=1283306 RepID=A0AAE3NDE1_9BURK|nr:lysophospholipid acyltransferase family protein [Xenophilus arseniciresistens]MDA7418197.1 lysophospholipid acyltransferase family protein [Xenophilus arseniciresistens]